MHTVYLVDDDQPMIDSYWLRRGLFMSCNFEICGAHTNPYEALREIREKRPDAVISDLKMPGLTGIGLMEEIYGDMLPPLFVIVSAYQEFKDVRNFFLARGFDYLIKPVADSDLTELLNRLGGKLDYALPPAERATASPKLNEILDYLKEYSALNHTLESVGSKFSLNPNSICNLFSKHMGTTFSTYLQKLRMERVEELLLKTDLSIKEIAVKCGFSSQFYLARCFQKAHGLPPSQYRSELYAKPGR